MPNMEINTNENIRTAGQFAIEFQQNGNGGCIPVINGNPEPTLAFGFVSENDKQACAELLRKAAVATNGDVRAMQGYIMNAVLLAANDIKPDESVDVGGYELLISYEKKEIYFGTEKLADLSDIDANMEPQVIKALLVERANTALIERYYPYTNDDEEEYGEEFDW